MTPLFIFLFIE